MEKYKVVVDTNIFVSAFLGSKNAKLIVRDIFTEQYSLIMSHEQLKEVKTVLQRPKFSKYIHPHKLDEFISLLSLKAVVPSNYGRINDCRDEKDNMITDRTIKFSHYHLLPRHNSLHIPKYLQADILTLYIFR